jgi:hypothetical protein
MRKPAVVLVMILTAACGGESERGTTGGDGSAGQAGAAGADARAGGGYIPDDSNVTAEGDGLLEGGSFEGNLGNGWDFCHSKHPGTLYWEDSDRSSHGTTWLAFDSQKSCAESFACSADGADAQVSFWVEPAQAPGAPIHLYFDAINLGPTMPAGALHIDATEGYCTSSAELATISLRDLELTSGWSTRCVSFTPSSALSTFGLYVTGETFLVGLDAFRFGPPCQN